MVHKVVALARTPVTLSNDHFSAQQFVQDLARDSSQKNAFFVADLGKIHLLVSEWTAKLPRVQPFYAMNANSDELLLKVLASSGLGLHCSNRQQQEVALDFVGPDRLFYSNPNWTRATIAGAHTNNVGLLGFDSEADLSRMAKGKISNKLILNVRMDEEESVVGCNISNAPELLQSAADFGLDCVGVGFNMCVQRPGIFDSIIECAAQLFAIGRSMGLNMRVLNLGGGFPSPFSQHTPSFDQLCDQINISLDYYFPLEQNQNIAIIATPGRYFASSVFSLATRIVDKFETDASQITNDDFDVGQRGFVYKISEGYYGPFGCRIVPNCLPECLPLFADLEDDQTAELFYGSIHGPAINDEFDVVQKQCFLRQLNEGDWLLWQNMGAYTMGNVDSLDDEPCAAPQVYYFSKDSDWKYADDSSDFSDVFTTLEDEPCCDDGESEISEDSAIEMDCFWTAEWPII